MEQNNVVDETMYICPMHAEVRSDKPGRCPKCGMNLVLKNEVDVSAHAHGEESSYKPLVVIIGLILLATLALGVRDESIGAFSWVNLMAYFEAGFFLTFAGFKLLDVAGFAQGYATYDLLARRVYRYGFVYPFIELGLGLSYLVGVRSPWLFAATLMVMGFSGLGVVRSMQQKRKIQCACLGTLLKVPLSSVTLVEDFGMAILALLMLLGSLG